MGVTRATPHQAVILVGGEGTRLRPITSRVPKPVAPVLERPFIAYILDNLVRHGVERTIFSTGYLAAAIEAEIGDGSAYGLRVDYAVEDEPLGTAGAIANCAGCLDDESFFVFNGDVLSDVDLTALARCHRDGGGLATIYLTPVDDPRRYGVVRLAEGARVTDFLEKPSEWEGEALINAGVYVLEPEVLGMIPRGQESSIERDVFPDLARAGALYGHRDDCYWRDIGTPDSYLEAHVDILERAVRTVVADDLGDAYVYISPSASVDATARVVPPSYIGDGARVAAGARVGPLAVLGAGSSLGAGAVLLRSVVQSGVVVGPQARVEDSVITRLTRVGAGTQLDSAIIGESCEIGAGNHLAGGICLYPDTIVADGSIRFCDQLRSREG